MNTEAWEQMMRSSGSIRQAADAAKAHIGNVSDEEVRNVRRAIQALEDVRAGRWRSERHPEITVRRVDHQTDVELLVSTTDRRGEKSVDERSRTKPVDFTLAEWSAVKEFRGDSDLPEDPGVYQVPGEDSATGYVFQRNHDGEWFAFLWDEVLSGGEAERFILAESGNRGLVKVA